MDRQGPQAGLSGSVSHIPHQEEAAVWITEQESKINAGRFQHLDSEPTVREIIQRYMEEVCPTKKGKREEVWRLKAIQRHEIASYAVGQLSPALIVSGVTSGSKGLWAAPMVSTFRLQR
ncbi:hypothetical protein BUMB_04374 [Candidatus Paraburkholderia calva]|nr:hypothetical protein BUMB_04374 [Candidatus Paraburkholderia calva]